MTGVDCVDELGAVLEKAVSETTCRGSAIERNTPGDRNRESLEGGSELDTAAADIWFYAPNGEEGVARD